jgi:uncharacterized protein (TIGR00730 family)
MGAMIKAIRICFDETRASGEIAMVQPLSNLPQLHSPSYRLAALDPDFILGDSTRAIRMALEYQKAEDALRAAKIESTIVVFGSARCAEDSPGDKGVWYREARKFGEIASKRGGAKDHNGSHLNVICTGGGPGIMEAANRGAYDAGAPSIGFNITLPHEEAPNPYTTPELTFRFHYFALRKMHFAMRAAALVVFPGGFGTMDELFEILTLRQTKKKSPLPIVLACTDFWRKAINFEAFVEAGTISPKDLDLFKFAEGAEEAWDALALSQH